MLRSLVIACLLAAASGLTSLPAVAAKNKADSIPPTRIKDLHYGDVLFLNFIGDDFEALTRLEAYTHWGLMPHHEGEADLLAGGLYLQMGIHNEAGRRFETLLGPEIPASVKARAWFYLAKVWYTRGYFDRTIESLGRIEGKLEPAQEAERVHLAANALMQQQKFDEAIALLSGWSSRSTWMQFARFNLGVALLRSNRLADGAQFLDAVGSLESSDEEMLALRDKANLALGFAYMQANDAPNAITRLERVRLNGPQSSRALLGLGWASAAQEKYEAALSPWLELRDRNLLDAAVQEAYLAVPYAFAKLGANGQAADYYEQALDSFDAEEQNIDAAIGRIRKDGLLENLLGEDADSPQRGWFWQLQELPDSPESRYLFPVLAGNDFQEGLKNYRDLAYLGSTLARWDENMVVYADMVGAREAAYAERIPRVDTMLGGDRLEALNARRKEVEGRMNDVVIMEDVAALGTEEQRHQWERIANIEAALAMEPDDEETAAKRDRLRLVKGALYWDLRQSYRERLYQQRSELKSLDGALSEASRRWLRVEQARKTAPTTTGDFAARISALQARMTALRAQLAEASRSQADLLADIAVSELDAQKQHIADYEVQARFALATIYDRAAEPPSTQPVPAAGTGAQ